MGTTTDNQIILGDLLFGIYAPSLSRPHVRLTAILYPLPNLSLDGVYSLLQIVQDKTSSTQSNLKKSGLNYENGRLSVKTDRVAPTRQEYIASTQRAFEKGGEVFKQNPSAFKMGAPVEGKSSSVDSTPYVQLVACTIGGGDADE